MWQDRWYLVVFVARNEVASVNCETTALALVTILDRYDLEVPGEVSTRAGTKLGINKPYLHRI
jgi:hypothetical protein